MKRNEISEFISKSIGQVKTGLPKDCVLNGNFDFDVSLVTETSKEGTIGIHLVGVGGSSSTQQAHRIRFSITDKKSMERNIKYAGKIIREIASELPQLDE